ncbi:MAG TPA: hypothetical protein VGM67_01485 [Gemmatimonadaceae bacterium]|jgi:hypothetical protein
MTVVIPSERSERGIFSLADYNLNYIRFLAALGMTAMGTAAVAQTPLPVRPIGPITAVSVEPLASAANALPMPDGRVLVNDITGHRLLSFDATLARAQVIADTTSATGNAYGARAGTLIPFHADSSLFIDPSSLSMLVIAPSGAIGRVMAVPRPRDAQHLIGNVFGIPGVDDRGRLVYYASAGLEGTFVQCCVGTARMELDPSAKAMPSSVPVPKPDSGFLVRIDLVTHTMDTAAAVRIANPRQTINVDGQGFLKSIESQVNPLPTVDVWTVLHDGSIAVVRGRDYHVDWLGTDGHWTTSPKMPFDWQQVDDTRKRALIDSTVAAEDSVDALMAERNAAATQSAGGGRGGPPGDGGRGGGGGGGRGDGGKIIPSVNGRIDPSVLPDYFPPFTRGAAQADADGHLWIRTSARVKGQPVYDVVNRQGVLVDRVQLPPFRTIAGFGPGVVYMAVKGPDGVVHLERAKIK